MAHEVNFSIAYRLSMTLKLLYYEFTLALILVWIDCVMLDLLPTLDKLECGRISILM